MKGADVLVVGLGATGLSMARHAAAAGKSILVVDTRAQPPGLPALLREIPQARFANIDAHIDAGKLALEAAELHLSSGVPPAELALPDHIVPLGDLELFTRAFAARWPAEADARPKLILVTGTNGKSTCATLAGGCLQAAGKSAAVVGNIGAAVLDEYARFEREGWPDAVVVEASSFQLALRQTALADIACLVNYAQDHLAWHRSYEAYLEAKQSVYSNAAIGIFNRADRASSQGAKHAKRRIGFGTARALEGEWTCEHGMMRRKGSGDEDSLPAADLVRVGIMPESASAALAIAEAAGSCVQDAAALGWLARQQGLAHRLQRLGCCEGVSYIDDSKATNQSAACAALEAVGASGTVLIAGGEPKDSDYAKFAKACRKLAGAVLIGTSASDLAQALEQQGVASRSMPDMNGAVAAAADMARRRGAKRILLSPGCASFDQYADYRARGEAFAAAFRRLAGRSAAHAC